MLVSQRLKKKHWDLRYSYSTKRMLWSDCTSNVYQIVSFVGFRFNMCNKKWNHRLSWQNMRMPFHGGYHRNLDFYAHVWKKNDGNITITSACPSDRYAISSFTKRECKSIVIFCHPSPWGTRKKSKGKISLNFNNKVNFKDFHTTLCVCPHKWRI